MESGSECLRNTGAATTDACDGSTKRGAGRGGVNCVVAWSASTIGVVVQHAPMHAHPESSEWECPGPCAPRVDDAAS